jgi:ribonuclease HI
MPIYYVVHKGIKTGIYHSWNECKKQVEKYNNAIYKKFDNLEDANMFLKHGFGNKVPISIKKKENADKKNETKIVDLENSSKEKIYIYSDGSCFRKKGIAVAGGYGIYIPSINVRVSVPMKTGKITNNRAEMLAIIHSVDYLGKEDLEKQICIFTDSQYSMYIFDKTGQRYKDNDYKKDGQLVPNIDLIEKMLEMKVKYDVLLLKVRAHTDKKDEHSVGNSIADKLAGDACFEMQSKKGENSIFSGSHSMEDSSEDEFGKKYKEEEDNNVYSDETENNLFMNKFKKKGFSNKIIHYKNELEGSFENDEVNDCNHGNNVKITISNILKKNDTDNNDNVEDVCIEKLKRKSKLKNGNLMNWVVPK